MIYLKQKYNLAFSSALEKCDKIKVEMEQALCFFLFHW